MQLWFQGTALHDLGKVLIVSQSRRGTPEENPSQWQVTMGVKIAILQTGFHENYARVMALHSLLQTARGTLKWTNEKVEVTYMERDATVVSHDCPEDPNAIGTFRQEVTITFSWIENLTADSDKLTATFQRSTGGPVINLGSITKWKESLRSQRFLPMHSERSLTTGAVAVSGRIQYASTGTIAARRTTLLAAKAQFLNEANGKDGTLIYGTAFSRLVRIEDADVDVDDASDSIAYSFTATFTRFPNEANFAVVEFTAATSRDDESGDETLSFSGKIGAPSTIVATAKLDLLRTAVLTAEGFSTAQRLKTQSDKRSVSVSPDSNLKLSTAVTIDETVNADTGPDADDYTFIELSFQEDYRKRASGVMTWTLSKSESEDIASGLNSITYAGSVVASGATADAAYGVALAKANVLGANQHPFLRKSNITANYRCQELPAPAKAIEFVRLEFSFEYQTKGTRSYWEVQSKQNKDALGDNTEDVSGFIVAATELAADAIYDLLLSAYSIRLVRNQNKTHSRISIAGVTPDPPISNMFTRLDFSFQLVLEKEVTEYGMRYEFDVSQDFVALEKSITISGTVFASSSVLAEIKLGEYLKETAGVWKWGDTVLGTRLSNRRGQPTELLPLAGSPTLRRATCSQLTFTETFVSAIDGDAAILECDMTEDIQHSGIRYVVQPIPDGPSVVQNCGTADGSRTVSGSVTAATEPAARNWVAYVKALPLWNPPDPSPESYLQPEKITTGWKWLPRSYSAIPDETVRGELAKFCVVNFSFTWILPSHSLVL